MAIRPAHPAQAASTNNNSVITWENLPPEVLGHIFSFGRPLEFIGAAGTNKHWGANFNDGIRWKELFQKYFPHAVCPSKLSDIRREVLVANMIHRNLLRNSYSFKYLPNNYKTNAPRDTNFIWSDTRNVLQDGVKIYPICDFEILSPDSLSSKGIWVGYNNSSFIWEYPNFDSEHSRYNTNGSSFSSVHSYSGSIFLGCQNGAIEVLNIKQFNITPHSNVHPCARLRESVVDAAYRNRTTLTGHQGEVTALASWNNILISGSKDASIRLWDGNLTLTDTLSDHAHAVTALSAVNGLLISGDEKGILKLWDLKTKKCIQTLEQTLNFKEVKKIKIDPPFVFAILGADLHVFYLSGNQLQFVTQTYLDARKMDFELVINRSIYATICHKGLAIGAFYPNKYEEIEMDLAPMHPVPHRMSARGFDFIQPIYE